MDKCEATNVLRTGGTGVTARPVGDANQTSEVDRGARIISAARVALVSTRIVARGQTGGGALLGGSRLGRSG